MNRVGDRLHRVEVRYTGSGVGWTGSGFGCIW